MNKTNYLCCFLEVSLLYSGRQIIFIKDTKGYWYSNRRVQISIVVKGREWLFHLETWGSLPCAGWDLSANVFVFLIRPCLTQGSSRLRSRHSTEQSIWDSSARDVSSRWGKLHCFLSEGQSHTYLQVWKGLVRWPTWGTLVAFCLEGIWW